MIRRICSAYAAEVFKAVRQKYTYVGPAILISAVLLSAYVKLGADLENTYGFIAYATAATLNLPGLLLLLSYCAGLVSTEVASGTIRLVLVRPISRWEFILAKILLGMTYAVVLTLAVAGACWCLALVFGQLTGVGYGGEILYTSVDMTIAYVLGFLLSLAPQFATVAYAVMVSSLTRSTGAAIGTSVGVWLVLDTVKYRLRCAPYLFSSYWETPWTVFRDQCDGVNSSWLSGALWCIGTSTAAFIAFTGVACYVFSRKSLHG